MDFVYSPEGVEKPPRWPWRPGRMKLADAELAEELSGQTHGEWSADCEAGSIKALHVLLFLHLRDTGVEFDAVEFFPDEVGFDLSDTERRELLDVLEAINEPTPMQARLIATTREALSLPPVEPPSEDPAPAAAAGAPKVGDSRRRRADQARAAQEATGPGSATAGSPTSGPSLPD